MTTGNATTGPSVAPVVQEGIVLLQNLLNKVSQLDTSQLFQHPVDEKYAPKYYSIIQHPMCFDTMRSKVRNCEYRSWRSFVQDFDLIFENARKYNQQRSRVHKAAVTLLRAGKKILQSAELEARKAIHSLNVATPNRVSDNPALEHSAPLISTSAAPSLPLHHSQSDLLCHSLSSGLHSVPCSQPTLGDYVSDTDGEGADASHWSKPTRAASTAPSQLPDSLLTSVVYVRYPDRFQTPTQPAHTSLSPPDKPTAPTPTPIPAPTPITQPAATSCGSKPPKPIIKHPYNLSALPAECVQPVALTATVPERPPSWRLSLVQLRLLLLHYRKQQLEQQRKELQHISAQSQKAGTRMNNSKDTKVRDGPTCPSSDSFTNHSDLVKRPRRETLLPDLEDIRSTPLFHHLPSQPSFPPTQSSSALPIPSCQAPAAIPVLHPMSQSTSPHSYHKPPSSTTNSFRHQPLLNQTLSAPQQSPLERFDCVAASSAGCPAYDSDMDPSYLSRVYCALGLLDAQLSTVQDALQQVFLEDAHVVRNSMAAAAVAQQRRSDALPPSRPVALKGGAKDQQTASKRRRMEGGDNDGVYLSSLGSTPRLGKPMVTSIAIPTIRELAPQQQAERLAALASPKAMPGPMKMEKGTANSSSSASSSSEDTSDSAFRARHLPLEQEEHQRYQGHTGGAQKRNSAAKVPAAGTSKNRFLHMSQPGRPDPTSPAATRSQAQGDRSQPSSPTALSAAESEHPMVHQGVGGEGLEALNAVGAKELGSPAGGARSRAGRGRGGGTGIRGGRGGRMGKGAGGSAAAE